MAGVRPATYLRSWRARAEPTDGVDGSCCGRTSTRRDVGRGIPRLPGQAAGSRTLGAPGGCRRDDDPPTITHNRIAGNLERLLNNRLERHAPSLLATQRPGLELGSGDCRPEPDVGVIDADYEAGQRFVEKAYLLSEVLSDTDEVMVPGTDRKWIDVKRDVYRSHEHCQAVLVIAQDRMEVELDLKTETGWNSSVLKGGAEFSIPAFGLWCVVSDLYEGTPLQPRSTPRHRS